MFYLIHTRIALPSRAVSNSVLLPQLSIPFCLMFFMAAKGLLPNTSIWINYQQPAGGWTIAPSPHLTFLPFPPISLSFSFYCPTLSSLS